MPDPHELVGVRIRQRLDQHGVDDAEDRRGRADAERQREDRSDGEGWLLPQHARGIPQVHPDIAEHVAGRQLPGVMGTGACACCSGAMVLRQQVPLPELGERQTRGLVLRRAARHQLAPAVLEMLRQLFDNLVLAGRREPQRRQPRTQMCLPNQACSSPVTRRTASTNASQVFRCCARTRLPSSVTL